MSSRLPVMLLVCATMLPLLAVVALPAADGAAKRSIGAGDEHTFEVVNSVLDDIHIPDEDDTVRLKRAGSGGFDLLSGLRNVCCVNAYKFGLPVIGGAIVLFSGINSVSFGVCVMRRGSKLRQSCREHRHRWPAVAADNRRAVHRAMTLT